MKDNFDLKKYLVENKITFNSKILNEEAKGWLGTGIDEETLKTFILLYREADERESLEPQGIPYEDPKTKDGKDIKDLEKEHPEILNISYNYCAKGYNPDKMVQDACARTILKKRRLRYTNIDWN